MSWNKKALLKYKNELIQSTIISLLLTLVFSIWYILSGKRFEWQEINPISQPGILDRYFYSAFVFITIGAFLYYIVKLWKGLHFIFVKVSGSWELYKVVKWLVWTFLILITYFYIIPVIIGMLNAIISFFYNIFIWIMYVLPIPALFIAIFTITVYVLRFKDKRQNELKK